MNLSRFGCASSTVGSKVRALDSAWYTIKSQKRTEPPQKKRRFSSWAARLATFVGTHFQFSAFFASNCSPR